jgi:cation transport regulator ChaB
LPDDIRRDLPPMIQDIFRHAYNQAWSSRDNGRPAGALLDERARGEAWAAVRCAYTQIGTTWVLNRAA